MKTLFHEMHLAKFVFVVCLASALGLFIGGFFVTPMGVIDGSVLKAGGILLGFGALGIFGRALDKNKIATFERDGTKVVVGEQDD